MEYPRGVALIALALSLHVVGTRLLQIIPGGTPQAIGRSFLFIYPQVMDDPIRYAGLSPLKPSQKPV